MHMWQSQLTLWSIIVKKKEKKSKGWLGLHVIIMKYLWDKNVVYSITHLCVCILLPVNLINCLIKKNDGHGDDPISASVCQKKLGCKWKSNDMPKNMCIDPSLHSLLMWLAVHSSYYGVRFICLDLFTWYFPLLQ